MLQMSTNITKIVLKIVITQIVLIKLRLMLSRLIVIVKDSIRRLIAIAHMVATTTTLAHPKETLIWLMTIGMRLMLIFQRIIEYPDPRQSITTAIAKRVGRNGFEMVQLTHITAAEENISLIY
jgi:hypothetical protein